MHRTESTNYRDLQGPPGGNPPTLKPLDISSSNIKRQMESYGAVDVNDSNTMGLNLTKQPLGEPISNESDKWLFEKGADVVFSLNTGSLSMGGYGVACIIGGTHMLSTSLMGVRATRSGFLPLRITFTVMLFLILVYMWSLCILVSSNPERLKVSLVNQLDITIQCGLENMMRNIQNMYECCGSSNGASDILIFSDLNCTHSTPCADKIMSSFLKAQTYFLFVFSITSIYIVALIGINLLPSDIGKSGY